MSDDTGERTEKASRRKLREARRKGQLTRSQDLSAWLGIGTVAALLPMMIGAGADAGRAQFVEVAAVIRDPDPGHAVAALGSALAGIPAMLGVALAAVAVVAVVGSVAQGGIHLRGVPARYEQFNVIAGVKRLFGMQALWEGAKALMKTAAIGLALWFVVAGLMPVLMMSGAHSISRLLEIASSVVTSLLITAVAVGVLLAAVDVLVVMRRNRKHTRMTKKEARDEHKSTEGDPLVRGQRRARQMAMSRNRMIAAVADADVVLVNPTHVAVALRYEPGKSAPRVVAKGQGIIAERIRERAHEAGVPLVRDIPLARALHGACELGQPIPSELYTAVARVLVFVDGLKRRGAARGVHTVPQRKDPR
ncbi:EscU/YscU/HrcU family type III secretion system export apparatus switch protein [Microbacterium imperiale]|uniref:Flagellar biosynthesis protein FlhB n=1 Tax=Microbacterium imperiale TaxID=33884 RepID=A0A9W6HI21_9MICO|nr:EscU/YscU/HrcU family type III secretion system export apparatus switch protein [Microbacterium imperiale]MBP2420939.1 flagellar biosynthetic protein FlhB [Microbacterium imperiale]MDS0199946.1 EscU/YscU/HrcU family type III secretion system export apparatus switch protein [Microbacterium imperiale]BFE41281.1 flagellar biosynthesis protein FlhB [Microbacterium imperiale]GLJ80232.1 flagellar biosynthesis protein FlhB [Microbacterium imperiale]